MNASGIALGAVPTWVLLLSLFVDRAGAGSHRGESDSFGFADRSFATAGRGLGRFANRDRECVAAGLILAD